MRKIILVPLVSLLLFACKPNETMKNTSVETKIDSLLNLLTLEEKIGMIHASSSFTSGGVERLGIPEIIMSDGPHGVRHEHGRDWEQDSTDSDYATYLPVGIALSSTWNRELGYQFGSVLGSEAEARGKDMILGPGINIIRSPLNGRNFEYLSEDPFLTAEMAVGYIKGVQDQGIAACAKHFVANNQETLRNYVDVELSERALQEIYLPAFKASVQKAGVLGVMGAYNKVRGQYCSHNKYLVNKVLKEDYGFSGVLVSDWGAVWDTKEALENGTDIEMGTDLRMKKGERDYNKFILANAALKMVENGEVPESVVDDKVRRILRVMYKTHMFEDRKKGDINTPEHQALAKKVAEEAIVLLKNEDLLPIDIKSVKTIAVIGHNAIYKHAEFGGSSQVKTLYEVTPLEGIKNIVGEKAKVVFAQGYKANKENLTDEQLAKEAVEIAKKADVVIFVGGWIHNFDNSQWGKDAYDCEGKDKTDLKLMFGQEKLINDLVKVNPNTAVVLYGGSPVEMNNWLGNVPAYIQAWYPGMEGGNALAEIIFGLVNPSGKLPVTFANSYKDYPAHSIGEYPGIDSVVHYNEGIMVGYRYFASIRDAKQIFPFGYGLSYTQFDYNNLELSVDVDEVVVNFEVTNSGGMDGMEIAQVYISKDDSEYQRPAIELKGFDKKNIPAGETQNYKIVIDKSSLQIYDEVQSSWVFEPGKYTIKVGSSSKDIELVGEVSL